MATRRQEKVARVIKEAVSDAIQNRLNDPRIEGLISVTEVEVAADLRSANVYISIFGSDETAQKRTFMAITHAKNRIQSFVAERVKSRFCPILFIRLDEKLKKTLEVLKLIDQVTGQTQENSQDPEEST
jgi:ribosome-binding factor A